MNEIDKYNESVREKSKEEIEVSFLFLPREL